MKSSHKMTMIGMLLLFLVAAVSASALTVDSTTGAITNWGVTPFSNGSNGNWLNGPPVDASGINGSESGQTSTIAWSEGNNVSPIDFGKSPAYTPSPGGSTGERFDLEYMAWRTVNNGSRIQVLGITSVNPNAGAAYGSNVYHVGDLFINTDNSAATGYHGYDMALTTGNWSTNLADPLHPADGTYNHNLGSDLFAINGVQDVHGITSTVGYGNNATIANATNPFAVREGAQAVANANVTMNVTSHDYGTINGFNENGTWIIEWEFDTAALGINPDDLGQISLHWTMECGNDLLERGPRLDDPVVPEPATLTLFGLGLVTLGVARRRMRRA